MSQPLLAQSSAPAANPPTTVARPLSLDDLYSDLDLVDASLSPYWSPDNEKLALTAIDIFLWQHLGPGFGARAPPASAGATAK